MRVLKYGLLIICLTMSGFASALSDLDYLPKSTRYDSNIPTPEQVLGYPVGAWHVRHDQLVYYMRALADASPRIQLIETGRTHEQRPLLLLQISTPQRLANLDKIREAHLARMKSGDKADTKDPLILWMGYSVHGNESSGSNAALLVAYYLAAAQGPEINKLLEESIILLDPSLNPDGLSRFAQWANMHKGQQLNADSQHREHREAWPSGRTNHYWFDLNRDWLPLVHPESRARIRQFHAWRPHVLTDFHEMGTNSTYFFQPGISSRKNPWTPEDNVRLTHALAKHHAKALDASNQLYYTQESFDDFYYGKGSTYPDALGTIGILFEQASSRGHLQESVNGDLSFPHSIQNQVTTSLSTFTGALENKAQLQAYQSDFYTQTKALIDKDKQAGFLVGSGRDASKLATFKALLTEHQIQYRELQEDTSLEGERFAANQAIYISLDQGQYRLLKSLFSTRQSFNDNSFYDVSNWNMALAYNLSFQPLTQRQARKLDLSEQAQQQPLLPVQSGAYAYGFAWQDSNAPALLQALLKQKVKVRLAGDAFSAKTVQGEINLTAGSVLIPSVLAQPDNLTEILSKAQIDYGIQLWSITSGLTSQGIDLGSEKMLPLNTPSVLLIGGGGTSQYEVGEIWHHLDTNLGLAATITDLYRLDRLKLDKYSHIIWASGNYSSLSEAVEKKIGSWLKAGGTLIGQKSASHWFSQKGWLKAEFVKAEEIKSSFDVKNLKFSDREALGAQQQIAGAVFNANLDLSHPLTFGLTRVQQPLFRNHEWVIKMPEKPFVTVAQYTDSPLLAGYTAKPLQDWIADSAAIVAHKVGKGRVIAFADNPVFRGYWLGSSRLLSNAIYQSGFIDVQG